MATAGLPEPFSRETIADVAEEHPIDAATLQTLVADHQALMDRLPGVENLLYEWRKQFDAELLARSAGWYVVDAPSWVWDEFASALDAETATLAALAAVHEQTAAELATGTSPVPAEGTPVVLVRDDSHDR